MNSRTQSILTQGFKGTIIDIECQLSNSLPTILIIGLGSRAVDEAKDRIRNAFTAMRIPLPRKRITINLAPADLPKDSASLDMAIAAAIILSGINSRQNTRDYSHTAFIGEIGLTGMIRPVRGIIGKILSAQKQGIEQFFIPKGNVAQASMVENVTLKTVTNLRDLYMDITNEHLVPPVTSEIGFTQTTPTSQHRYLLSNIAGQEKAKRALIIAAAGGHNILLSGPPGTGKTMLAKTLPSILPQLSYDEIIEVTHIHSLTSDNFEKLVADRPFRAPHHSASPASVMGGGTPIKPGEFALSNKGVLLLDEMPEFNRIIIEALRQPLEDKTITISRARESVDYPADFILVATANPCPCGFYGSSKECSCSMQSINRYQKKISGPILDRIDLYVVMNEVNPTDLLKNSKSKTDLLASKQVQEARTTQKNRFANKLNCHLSNSDILKHADITQEGKSFLNTATAKLSLSARAYMRVLRVARTIADIDSSSGVKEEHIMEALQYRPKFGHPGSA